MSPWPRLPCTTSLRALSHTNEALAILCFHPVPMHGMPLRRTLRDVRKQEEDIIRVSKTPRNYSTPLPADKTDSSAADGAAANKIGSLFRLIANYI